MIITTVEKITFKIPEEHDAKVEFNNRHDISEWKESITPQFVTYQRKQSVICDYKKEEK